MKKTLILTTATWLVKNGLSKIGTSVDFCLMGSALFLDANQTKKIDLIKKQLSEKRVTVHEYSEITRSENSALKTIAEEFRNWRQGGLLIVTNDHMFAPVAEKLKEEFGKRMMAFGLTGEKTDDTDESTGKTKEKDTEQISAAVNAEQPSGQKMQQWES